MNLKLNESLTRRFLEAYNKSGRTDLKLSEILRKFVEAYEGIVNFSDIQPKLAGDYFATYLSEQPAALSRTIDAPLTHVSDAIETQMRQMREEGLSNRAIAKALGISEATVRRKLKP